MQPFFTLMIVVASTVMLAGCGGGNDVKNMQSNTPIMIITGDEITSFDKSKIISNTPNKPLDQSTGYISNQMWVVPNNISKNVFLDMISSHKKLKVIAYDDTFGAKIEFDEKDNEAISQINSLRSDPRILSVFYEYFSGKDVKHDFFTPNNGSSFNDGGNNWGLEEVNITKAWDITTGEKTGYENIGIIDSGFLTTHSVLSNRLSPVGENIPDDHGTAVAGIIGGRFENNDGFSGINQKSDIFVMYRDCENQNFQKKYIEFISTNNIKVINNSWGCMDASNSNANVDDGFNATRKFRAIAILTPQTIHVWSSGNAGASASTQNGSLHLDNNKNEDKIENIITVAAYGNNDALVSYSNYGGLVDIAVPTDIKAPSADGGYYQAIKDNYTYGDSKLTLNNTEGFAGTSASAPILTGVISLMLSVNPSLTPKQVKNILIRTSTKTILKRTLTDGTFENIQPLPTLNAERAVSFARTYGKPTDISPKTAIVGKVQEFTLTNEGGLLEKPYSISIEGCPNIQYISATSTVHTFSCTPTYAISSLVVIKNPDTGILINKNLAIDFTLEPTPPLNGYWLTKCFDDDKNGIYFQQLMDVSLVNDKIHIAQKVRRNYGADSTCKGTFTTEPASSETLSDVLTGTSVQGTNTIYTFKNPDGSTYTVTVSTTTLTLSDDPIASPFTHQSSFTFPEGVPITNAKYSKISNTGAVLLDSATLGNGANDWVCTKDNTTNLIWEVKTDDDGFRDKDWTYSWYDPNAATNFGGSGVANRGTICKFISCDTFSYTKELNSSKLCGQTQWKTPSYNELLELVDTNTWSVKSDTFFPNTVTTSVSAYWTSTTYSAVINDRYTDFYAKFVTFNGGFRADAFEKNTPLSVRAVSLSK